MAGYHGPHLGPTLRAGHSWMQKGESAADWRGGGAATNRMKEIGEAAPAAGELLCLLVNVIKPGIVPKIARDESTAAMTEQRRNAKMRENIGQYVDGCAELGVSTGELFITA